MPPPEDLRAHIATLKQQAQNLKAEKTKVNKALRNAEKKRARLKRKARELTDADLLQVLKLRNDEQAERQAAGDREGALSAAGSGASRDRNHPALLPPLPQICSAFLIH